MSDGKERYVLFGDGRSPHLLKWARYLADEYDLYVVSGMGFHPDLSHYVSNDRLFSLCFEQKRDGGNWRIIKRLPLVISYFRQIRPDIVNAHFITSYGLLAVLSSWFVKPFRIVLSAWGSDILVSPDKSRTIRWLTRFCLCKADLITSDSGYMSEKIFRLSGRRAKTFYYGVDQLPQISFDEKEPWLFFSNRALARNYNVDSVLVHFSHIASKVDKAKLVVANDGPMKESLQRLTKELALERSVYFVGYLTPEQQESYYRRASFFISLPTSDSISVSLIEALSFGCIPLLSDLPSQYDLITEFENGFFVRELDDTNYITKDIQRLRLFESNRVIINKKAVFPREINKFIILLSLIKKR